MPELAEVEFFRKRWDRAGKGSVIKRAEAHEKSKIFRGTDVPAILRALTKAKFISSETAAKQMLFRFTGDAWLGIHLGMSGDLSVGATDYQPKRHDHLVLFTAKHTLIFSDPRMFGRVQFSLGKKAPAWWTRIAPAILSNDFTVEVVTAFLKRRARAPIKAVLLMQERFPGIGNWMADEILWRAAIHPRQPAGSLRPAEIRELWKECRRVCELALKFIAGKGRAVPDELNKDVPDSWLFPHRWSGGGVCPKTKKPLRREEIGGRTTCWSPARQKLHS